MKLEIEYPVNIAVAYRTGGEGTAKLTRKVTEQYTALVEMLVALLADEPVALKACEVITEAGLSEGPRQGYLDYHEAHSPPEDNDEQRVDEGNGELIGEQLDFADQDEQTEYDDQDQIDEEQLDSQLDEPPNDEQLQADDYYEQEQEVEQEPPSIQTPKPNKKPRSRRAVQA